MKVKWLNPPGDGGAQATPKDKLESLFKKFGAKAKAIAKEASKGTPKTAAKPTTAPAENPAEGDDVPY